MSQLYLSSLGTGGHLRELLIPFLEDFLSFFNLSYATTSILSFILWFPLALLVQGLHLGDCSTLISHLSTSSCASPRLLALYIVYLKPSFHHLLQMVTSSQQVQPTRHPQTSTMTSYSNIPAPLCDDGLHYCTIYLAILNELSVTELSHIHYTSMQELRQALGKSVTLAQHLLENP
jgi:hypothetical protein